MTELMAGNSYKLDNSTNAKLFCLKRTTYTSLQTRSEARKIRSHTSCRVCIDVDKPCLSEISRNKCKEDYDQVFLLVILLVLLHHVQPASWKLIA